MRWGQVATAVIVGMAVFGVVSESSYGVFTSLAAGIVGYILARWAIAWVFRTRHWTNRDGTATRRCPSCDQSIYRVRGDFVLECKRCGWKPMVPGLRLLTHSVATKQLRRTVYGPALVVVLLLSGGILYGVTGELDDRGMEIISTVDDATGTNADDDTDGSDGIADGAGDGADDRTGDAGDDLTGDPPDDQGDGHTDDQGDGYTDGSFEEGELDLERVEELVVEKTNEARLEHDESTLEADSGLAAVARAHSVDMVERDYFNHTSPEGDGPLDRVQDSDVDCTGVGENLGQAYWEREFAVNYGEEYVETNEELADALVKQWLNSPGHRDNLLHPDFTRIGVGLEVDGDLVVATQKLCF